MFVPIAIEEFIKNFVKNNPKEDSAKIRAALIRAVEAKKSGTVCGICGQPIWAIGSISGTYRCFTCITGEADGSEDYEIDSVCF
jgi:hypothetical protein